MFLTKYLKKYKLEKIIGKHIKRSDYDSFFTIPSLASKLITECEIDRYDLVIEPSAGNGSFSNQIQGCLAFDLNPQHPSIIKQDFLNYEYAGEVNKNKILCIGNPPYGINNSLTIQFIKKCTIIADTIAFILPRSFKKLSMQDRIPITYHLIKQIDLGEETSTLNGKLQHIPVVFQIWQNRYTPRDRPEYCKPNKFEYVKKNKADFSVRRVGAYAGRASKNLAKSETAHYYIKCDFDVIDKLNSVNWPQNNTTGQRSLSKSELNKELNQIILQLAPDQL